MDDAIAEKTHVYWRFVFTPTRITISEGMLDNEHNKYREVAVVKLFYRWVTPRTGLFLTPYEASESWCLNTYVIDAV